ncbi:MAG TPA: TlpA disulfide reductase family protein [Nevskiaceae bacterium]|nr:TlpA disulfide reductase family protein [Nevskiaceae bacterium]
MSRSLRGLAALLLALPLAAAAVAPPAIAPAWTLQTPDGETVRFPEDAAGAPTVLMFWPSWCPFSRALQPYVDDIHRDYRAAGVRVWTLNIRETRDPAAVLRERGLSFPVLVQADAVARTYGLRYTPWLVVIDGRDQRIVYTRPPRPPSPIDTAREVREQLNRMLGPERAVALPTAWAPPYDLHLRPPTAPRPLTPVAVPASVWQPWVRAYLAAIPAAERMEEQPAAGPIASGKEAIGRARALWTEQFGEVATRAQSPYRAYSAEGRWVVLGDGGSAELGKGFVAVFEADSGAVIRSHGVSAD